MVGLIVVLLVLPEQVTQCHRAAEEEEVRAQYHQRHSEEEHQQGTYGVCGADGEEIGNAQQEHAQYRRKPADFGRPFSRLFPTQQLHWLGNVNLSQRVEEEEPKGNECQQDDIAHGVWLNGKAQRGVRVQRPCCQKFRQLG